MKTFLTTYFTKSFVGSYSLLAVSIASATQLVQFATAIGAFIIGVLIPVVKSIKNKSKSKTKK